MAAPFCPATAGPIRRLAFLRTHEPPRDGDRVLTSGDGGVFPRGLPVGSVVKGFDGAWRVALDSDSAPIDFVQILLFTDFSQLDSAAGPGRGGPAFDRHRTPAAARRPAAGGGGAEVRRLVHPASGVRRLARAVSPPRRNGQGVRRNGPFARARRALAAPASQKSCRPMNAVTVRPLNPLLWIGGPALICAAASLLFAAPFGLFGLQLPEPVFALVPAFAWPIIRTSLLPPLALLLLGLFLDLLWGGPLGVWPISLLAAYAPVLFGRAFLSGQGFWSLWAWYVASCAAALGTGWILTAIKAGAAPNLLALAWQFGITLLLFPFAFRLIQRYEDADVRFR